MSGSGSAGVSRVAASIVICTYRRVDLLRRCLRGCAAQRVGPGVEFEVLVVDNDCSAEVEQLVASVAVTPTAGQFRYIPQAVLGLTHSRNAGLQHAQGDVVVFLDDDAAPIGTGWLAVYLERFRDPRVGAVGGPIVPDFDGRSRPPWLSRHVEAKYSVLAVATAGPARAFRRQFPFRSRLLPMGANVAFRSALVDDFDERTSRVGASLVSRDELPALRSVEAKGGTVWLEPGAAVLHHVPRDRLTPEWIERRFDAEGASRVADRLAGGGAVLRSALRGIGHALVTSVLALLIPLTSEQGRWLAVRCRLIEARSELRASVRALAQGSAGQAR